jgi:hypothetical protein
MKTTDNKITSKNIYKFNCEPCDFNCYKAGDWSRHILTRKHINGNKITSSYIDLHPHNEPFKCKKCNNSYKYNTGLSRHSKTCKEPNEIKVDLILEIMKENKELKELIIGQNNTIIELSKQQNNAMVELSKQQNSAIIELSRNIQPIQHITQNNHNKTFHLNVFLNETCKDAINITDFVNSIKIELKEFEHFGEVGFINGITQIMVKNLKLFTEETRPVHCTDQKRKVVYVKDNNEWIKEETEYKTVRKAIKTIAHMNFKTVSEFKKTYPYYADYDSRDNTRYHLLMAEVLGGSGKEDHDNEDKIINNILKDILIKRYG